MNEILTKIYSEYFDSCFIKDKGEITLITNPLTYNKWYDCYDHHIKKMIRKYKLEKIKKAVI